MKKIAIPTDFSFQTLKNIQLALHIFPHETLEFFLFSWSEPPTDTQDLISLPSDDEVLSLKMDNDFCKGVALLEKNYAYQISKIEYDHYWGSLASVSKHIAISQQTDLFLIPFHNRDSGIAKAEMMDLFHKSPCPLLLVPEYYIGKNFTSIGWYMDSGLELSHCLQLTDQLFMHQECKTVFFSALKGKADQKAILQLMKLLEEKSVPKHISLEISPDHTNPEGILQSVLAHQVDVLLLQYNTSFFGMKRKKAILEKVADFCPIPIVVIPQKVKASALW